MAESGVLPPVSAPSLPDADSGHGFDWKRLPRKRMTTPACVVVAGVVLFFLYFAQARRTGFASDGAVIAQQGWDVLHGNLLLHGWEVPDIAFYTIEVPEFAVLEWLRGGITPGVVAALEALNLTVVVLLVALQRPSRC